MREPLTDEGGASELRPQRPTDGIVCRRLRADILHALRNAIAVVDLEPDPDPPKVLAIGPDRAGNLLEVVWLELADNAQLVIHAMPLRPAFYDLLPFPGEDTP